MALSNATVLENLLAQKVELEKSIEGNREMYLKVIGAIEVLQQIEDQNTAPEVSETEVVGEE